MNDDIICMARSAGMHYSGACTLTGMESHVERFANLVAAAAIRARGQHMTTQIEAMKLALEALEKSNRFVWHYAHSKETTRIAEQCDAAITALRTAIEAAPVQEPVKPYAYEYGRDNGDGTFSIVIERGSLSMTRPGVYNYVRPENAHKDWPIKELFDNPPAAQPAVPLTDEEAHNVGERAEELLGHGHGAWDTRPLHEIVHAVLTAAEEMNGGVA
jgi:hypothetical protein